MGMYTELIFGASLKKETPKEVIDILRYMCGQIDKPKVKDSYNESILEEPRNVFNAMSYYFGVSESAPFMEYDEISKQWIVSTRGNIRNYDDQIERFLTWIRPYVDSGTGSREIFGIVCYEESEIPTMYCKYETPYGEKQTTTKEVEREGS